MEKSKHQTWINLSQPVDRDCRNCKHGFKALQCEATPREEPIKICYQKDFDTTVLEFWEWDGKKE